MKLIIIAFTVILFSDESTSKSKIDIFDSSRFLSLNELYDYYKKLAKLAPNVAKMEKIGDTFIEGKEMTNNIYAFIIGTGKNPILFFDCGMHAREWLSHATCAYIIQKLVLTFEFARKNPGVIKVPVLNYDWHFIPVANPDGYQMSKDYRMYRKNGRPEQQMQLSKGDIKECAEVCSTTPIKCSGIDLNRNLPGGWGLGDSSFVKNSKLYCTEIYKGKKPLSEPETIAFHNYVTKIRKRSLSAISIHTYGMDIYHPLGWMLMNDPEQVSGKAKQLLEDFAKHFNQELNYRIGTVAELLQPNALSGGATDDYYYYTQKFNITYTIELDPIRGSSHGFDPPASMIKPVGHKLWRAFQRMAEKMDMIYKRF